MTKLIAIALSSAIIDNGLIPQIIKNDVNDYTVVISNEGVTTAQVQAGETAFGVVANINSVRFH